MSTNSIAIIPARGGSKRIPRKNIRLFHGRPMIAWPIGVALESKLFDTVLVSTDDEEVASVAVKWGAQAPFRRPAELANDHVPTVPVIRHALTWWEENREPVKLVCSISATAPFLRAEDLERGQQALESDPTLHFSSGVARFSSSIFRALRLDAKGHIGMYWPEYELTRSQDLPEAWHDAGQFDWGTAAAWRDHKGTFSARSVGIPLPLNRVQDVDTHEDWARAEVLFHMLSITREPPLADPR